MTGTILNIQSYSITDGPGIRTVVFFKGCPLQCLWCANPESINPNPQLSFHHSKCIFCQKCQYICTKEAIQFYPTHHIDWSKCDNCGRCTDVCMSEALEMVGKKMTIEEIIDTVKRENALYRRSRGGVTISGGEATLQYDFLVDLLIALKNEDIHVVLETSGFLPWNKLEPMAKLVDIFYIDIKGIDSELHKKNTGVDNELILTNVHKLMEMGCQVVLRIPIIPGLNDSKEQIGLLDEYLLPFGKSKIHLLPYHRFGEDKLNSIHTQQISLGIPTMKDTELEKIKIMLERIDRSISIGGIE